MTDTPAANEHDPGDLGRRVAERRRELGLERAEVARRAGMDPGYLEYVEERPSARPSPAACARLAAALDTTVAWLRGSGLERPPGSLTRPPSQAPVLEVLEAEQCLGQIRSGGVGRAVFDDSSGAVALPINFAMLGDTIVFRTGPGTIAAAVGSSGRLSVEVDHLDEALGEGWSVLASGAAAIVTEPDRLAEVEGLHLQPWAGGERPIVIAVTPEQLSGRRIRHRRSDDPDGTTSTVTSMP